MSREAHWTEDCVRGCPSMITPGRRPNNSSVSRICVTSRRRWTTCSTVLPISTARRVCSLLPAGHETKAEWKLPATSGVPVLALVGGADPQDPLGNLTGLHRHFRHATIVVAHGMAHTVGQYGCLGALVSGFVDRGGGKVEASCVRDIHPTPFPEES